MKRKSKASTSQSSLDADTDTTPVRRTRSQSVPEWSVQETMVLINEIAAIKEDYIRELSSFQKWKMIAENCSSAGVSRSSPLCKRRWESLLADYEAITSWESSRGKGSYWGLDVAARKREGLPVLFDQQVFGLMYALLSSQEEDSDHEDNNVGNADIGSGETSAKIMESTEKKLEIGAEPRENVEQTRTMEIMDDAVEIANKLHENTTQMQGSGETSAKIMESTEKLLEIVAKPQEGVEQTRIVEIMDNAVGIADESHENTPQMQGIENMNSPMIVADNLQEDALPICATEGIERATGMETKQQETQLHVIEIMNNVPDVDDKLQENVEQIQTVKNMDDSCEKMVSLPEENVEQIPVTENMDTEVMLTNELHGDEEQMNAPLEENVDQVCAINSTNDALNMATELQMNAPLEENVDQVCAINSTNDALNMATELQDTEPIPDVQENLDNVNAQLQENTEEIHENVGQCHGLLQQENVDKSLASGSIENAMEMWNAEMSKKKEHILQEMSNKLREKEETHVMMGVNNKALDMATLQENVEQIIATQGIDNAVEMTDMLQKNSEQMHTEHTQLMESAQPIHVPENNASGVTNQMQANYEEQGRAMHSAKETLNVANKQQEKDKVSDNTQENNNPITGIKITAKALKMANKLKVNAEQVHVVLRRDPPDHSNRIRETDFKRRQADELAIALGTLAASLDMFNDLIKETGCEVVRGRDAL